MNPFAGVLQTGGAPDAALLRCMGERLRLPGGPAPQLSIDGQCGFVAHHPGEITGEGLGLHEAWRQWKRDCVHHLPAEFSFAAWDGRELFCARDRFGARPFYYARTERAFVFSSVLEAVLAHPGVNTDLDDRAVADYLGTGVYDDSSATIYAHVRRLPPAHTLQVRDGRLVLRAYWTLPEPQRRVRTAERLETALRDAIRDRVTTSAAVVFMSGGLDSPALAALTREVRPETKLVAATSVYRTRIADVEEEHARAAARSIGIEHRVFPLDDYDPLQAIDEGLWTAEPGPLLSARITRDLYAAAAEDAPLALHGHPADAVLSLDLQGYLRALPFSQRAASLVRYTFRRRRPPYFFFRRRRVHRDALRSAIWASYFEWAHPSFTRARIELVYPWCDPRVVEAARELDPVPLLVDKYALREILRNRVAESVRVRAKTFVQGDPWRSERDVELTAAARYVDHDRFRAAVRRDGALVEETLRAVVLDHWLRLLPDELDRLRCA